jgi:hypothetical protein
VRLEDRAETRDARSDPGRPRASTRSCSRGGRGAAAPGRLGRLQLGRGDRARDAAGVEAELSQVAADRVGEADEVVAPVRGERTVLRGGKAVLGEVASARPAGRDQQG